MTDSYSRAALGLHLPTLKLDPARAIALTDAERAVAQTIASETEHERQCELNAGRPAEGTPWDELLLSPSCLSRCALRSELTFLAVLSFARDHCAPNNSSALFYFMQGISAAEEDPIFKERILLAVERARLGASRGAGTRGAKKRWGPDHPNIAAKLWVQKKWLEDKPRYRGNKSEFARAMALEVKLKFEAVDQISVKTITDAWLKGL